MQSLVPSRVKHDLLALVLTALLLILVAYVSFDLCLHDVMLGALVQIAVGRTGGLRCIPRGYGTCPRKDHVLLGGFSHSLTSDCGLYLF